ncbi:hypothetical protein [Frankia sp. CiP3]|uniref:hypothetical protein n=1 Tax=Frankia sp. CiP3 TaxID=2880971 RepID=UPI001EF6FF31|nr:hypothetical protein [Frankia sp. CiP3]
MTSDGQSGAMSDGSMCTITIRPADRPVDVMRAWASLPDGVGFAEAFGDVEVTLVFRPVGELMLVRESAGRSPVLG